MILIKLFWSTQRIIYPFRRNINIRAHKFLAVKKFLRISSASFDVHCRCLEGYFYDNLIAVEKYSICLFYIFWFLLFQISHSIKWIPKWHKITFSKMIYRKIFLKWYTLVLYPISACAHRKSRISCWNSHGNDRWWLHFGNASYSSWKNK